MRPNLKNLTFIPIPFIRGGISSDVDGKEESLKRLNDIGFADEDLLCLRSLLEKIGNKEGTHVNQTKESFFRALDYFGSLSELRKIVKKETETIKEIRNKLKCIFDSITKEAG